MIKATHINIPVPIKVVDYKSSDNQNRDEIYKLENARKICDDFKTSVEDNDLANAVDLVNNISHHNKLCDDELILEKMATN